jgi:hypothetical protein
MKPVAAAAAAPTFAAAAAAVVCAQVQEVVLVEVQDAKVSHAGIARAVSRSWGGDAAVTVLTVTSRGLAPASSP